MELMEKAAYIKGLADGLELDTATKEGKLIAALIELVGEMAERIEELDADIGEVYDYAEELDEDLGAVEEVLLDLDDDDCDCDCGCCDCCDFDDEDSYEMECPFCGDTIVFDDTVDAEKLVCPACGKKPADADK